MKRLSTFMKRIMSVSLLLAMSVGVYADINGGHTDTPVSGDPATGDGEQTLYSTKLFLTTDWQRSSLSICGL